MSEARQYFVGISFVLGYIAIASLQSVALNVWLASADVYLVAGLSFLIVVACFVIVSLRTAGTNPYRFVFSRPGLVFALNITAVFNWLFYFLAVKYLVPAVAVTLTQGIGPLSMTTYYLLRREPVSYVTRVCHSVILVTATVMCLYVVDRRITNGPYDRPVLALAIGIAVLCSFSITATLTLSKTFAQEGIPASVVLSIRFPLLVVICFVVLPTQSSLRLSGGIIALVFGVALIGIATAAYLLQRGIEMAPRLAVSTCLALSPLVVFAIGAFRATASDNRVVLALIASIVLVSLISIIYDGNQLRTVAAPSVIPQDSTAEETPNA